MQRFVGTVKLLSVLNVQDYVTVAVTLVVKSVEPGVIDVVSLYQLGVWKVALFVEKTYVQIVVVAALVVMIHCATDVGVILDVPKTAVKIPYVTNAQTNAMRATTCFATITLINLLVRVTRVLA